MLITLNALVLRMGESIFSYKHANEEACPGCGTPIRHGVTTQFVDDLDIEICAVCEQPLLG